MAIEKDYDSIVAPMLHAVAVKCAEMGMVMVARVEWEPGECGITRAGDNMWSMPQAMTFLAAHSLGNFDQLGIEMLRRYNCSASIMLSRYQSEKPRTAP